MPSCFVLLFLSTTVSGTLYRPNREPPIFEGLPTIKELAAAGGYTVTNYEVITEDGYSLWLHRIGNETGPPVLMQHGIFVAADSWITRGNGKNLVFMLLKEGYDVWLSNQRGTAYNEYSLKYERSDPAFWDFSFHESGYYDIPAFIDAVLEAREVDQLFYIGHSLGTTVFLVAGSTRPEYNSKVRGAVLLSPIAYPPTYDEMWPAVRRSLQHSDLIYSGLMLIGLYEVGNRTPFTIAALRELCSGFITQLACLDFLALMSGEHRTNLDMDEWFKFVPFYGAGTSVKTLYHFSQVYRSGEFKQFDYGPEQNIQRYDSPVPPTYRLDNVTAPIAMYWGRNDPLLSETSVKRLESQLANVKLSTPVSDPEFTHIDMILGDDAHRVLYPEIIDYLKSL